MLRWGSQEFIFQDAHENATVKRRPGERNELWIEFSGNEGTGSSERFAAVLHRSEAHARLVHVEPIALSHQQPYLIVSMQTKTSNRGACTGMSLRYEFDLLKYDHDPEFRYHEVATACVTLGNHGLSIKGRLGAIYARLRNEQCMPDPDTASERVTSPCSGLNEKFWSTVAVDPDLASFFPAASSPESEVE